MAPVFRFAPSPNGDLHLGHALSALLNFDRARQSGGSCLLRIEDIDLARCRPEFEQRIYEDLRWLGLSWPEPVRRQSEHADFYRAGLDVLKGQGLVYPAFLSRAEVKARVAAFETGGVVWPRDPDGTPFYPTGERDVDPELAARRIAAGDRHAWRLDMGKALAAVRRHLWRPPSALPGISPSRGESDSRLDLSPTTPVEDGAFQRQSGARSARRLFSPLEGEMPGRAEGGAPQPLFWLETGQGTPETIDADPSVWGDVVVWRWDAPSSYHLSVVMDDALQGVTHVVRGRDLIPATPLHRLLQTLLGLPTPAYHHHLLLLDEGGEKLAKSRQSTGIRALRQRGVSPSDIRGRIGLAAL